MSKLIPIYEFFFHLPQFQGTDLLLIDLLDGNKLIDILLLGLEDLAKLIGSHDFSIPIIKLVVRLH